ncbi:MAG TPA: 16S rRNA (cytosine(1402)-N(4))-methyltransferase, partial [Burkholderiaceae bacterium]
RFIDLHAHPDRALPRVPLRAAQLPAAMLRALARVRADADEIAANPRARSALMRVAERTGAPAQPT